MLGRFLELSVAAPNIQESLEFYRRLGFSEAMVGEAWPHAYAVVTDGRVCIGLHDEAAAQPIGTMALTFVRPGLLQHLASIERLRVEFAFRRLGNDVFNEVGWFDPAGHLIRLIEARTFSPGRRAPADASPCGHFAELGLPSPDLAASKSFYETLGFVGMEEGDARQPHVSCISDTIGIGLYSPADLRRTTLLFDCDDVDAARRALSRQGLAPTQGLQRPGSALFVAPEGTALLIRDPSG